MTTDERLDRIDQSLEVQARSLEAQARSIEAQARSIEVLTQTANAQTQSVNTLTRHLLDFRQETVTLFQTTENRLDILATAVASLDSRMPGMSKALMNFGADHTMLLRDHSRLKEADTDLAARVAKLEQIVSKLVPAA